MCIRDSLEGNHPPAPRTRRPHNARRSLLAEHFNEAQHRRDTGFGAFSGQQPRSVGERPRQPALLSRPRRHGSHNGSHGLGRDARIHCRHHIDHDLHRVEIHIRRAGIAQRLPSPIPGAELTGLPAGPTRHRPCSADRTQPVLALPLEGPQVLAAGMAARQGDVRRSGAGQCDQQLASHPRRRGATIAEPVSYTHLDVYKRQPSLPMADWP